MLIKTLRLRLTDNYKSLEYYIYRFFSNKGMSIYMSGFYQSVERH